MYTVEKRDKNTPPEADFSLRYTSNDMSPVIEKGDTVYIRRRQLPEDGEVGLFLVEEKMILRQFCQDSQGTVYLFCLNRKYRERDVVVPKSKVRPVCFGTAVLRETPPLPTVM